MTAETAGVTQAPPKDRRAPAVVLRGAQLRYGSRVLWDHLDLTVRPGEFIAVLGPNGSGKTSLLRVLLGLQPLTGGTVTVAGAAPGAGNRRIGYIPQQHVLDGTAGLRGRDLVGFGLDGHRWGIGPRDRKARRRIVDAALAAVGATRYADARVLYLVDGRFEIGTPAEVMTSQTLSALYRTQVDVIRVRDQIVVVGAADSCAHHVEDTVEQA